MRFAVLLILRIFFRIFYRIEVLGLENIPKEGPLLAACNHNSNADPPVLMSFLSLKRKAHILAKKELFSPKILGTAFSHFGAIPVDRKAPGGDLSAIKNSLKVLKGGGCLAIFPEGTRAAGKKVDPKGGAAFLALKSKAKILPVRIFNTENFSKLGKIIIVFGKPFNLAAEDSQNYEEASGRIMQEIFSLNRG
ncbi:MAG: 1-acyl-sn-glycerol-3-phosphate acyltransferase [Elusimicrobia bacterium]|nr:1-acyl-sn-glycerol-3-phosphate acyltransferase [Elusimicrobiota bacterium]